MPGTEAAVIENDECDSRDARLPATFADKPRLAKPYSVDALKDLLHRR